MKNSILGIVRLFLLMIIIFICSAVYGQAPGMKTVRVNQVQVNPNYQGNAIIDFSKGINTLSFDIVLHRIPLYESNKYESPSLKFSLVYQDGYKEIVLNSTGIFESSFIGPWATLNKFVANINTNEIDLAKGSIQAVLTGYYDNTSSLSKPTNIGFVNKDEVSLPFPFPMPNVWKNNYQKNGSVVGDIGNVANQYKKYSNAQVPLLTSSGNSSISSPTGNYVLVLQSDGNLVIYRSGTNTVMWASNVYVKNPSSNDKFALYIQNDGNLVVYKQNAAGQYSDVFWGANTIFVPNSDPYFGNVKYGYYLLQDDGNFVLYYPEKTNSGLVFPIASTNSGSHTISKSFGKFK
ncbi:hypothetical protein [Sphingobacterium detergens]|uniref:D-mannose binding lectin n=1 Tax=Sphingobacterium detergens TaxID=1145106 RepID=A0A420AXM4_SPHD1|nr:hypothetical protein [Sphingobacterium detergens]RKE49232.1 D-mannose binding lectin [Sphingobacterium detergens]